MAIVLALLFAATYCTYVNVAVFSFSSYQFGFGLHVVVLVTAGYFYDTFACEICFYGIYFYGVVFSHTSTNFANSLLCLWLFSTRLQLFFASGTCGFYSHTGAVLEVSLQYIHVSFKARLEPYLQVIPSTSGFHSHTRAILVVISATCGFYSHTGAILVVISSTYGF